MKLIILLLIALTKADFSTKHHLTAALYKDALKSGDPNFLLSATSALIVTGLTESGAKGQTAEQIRTVLHFPKTENETRAAFKTLISELTGNDKFNLTTANKIYVKEKYAINDDFKKVAAAVFQSDFENIDFAKNSDRINQWVANQTNNKIRQLIDPKELSDNTMVVLVNVLYFQTVWKNAFSRVTTSRTKFFKSKQEVIEVDSMRAFGQVFNYYESTDIKYLELPFRGEASMIVVLPNEDIALIEDQIEEILSTPQFVEQHVDVQFPKFKFESQFDLKALFQKIGIRKAFDPKQADFSGIAGKKGDLYIDEIVQKSFIDCSEEGVEAAAATDVDGIRRNAMVLEPKQFIVDKPFVFIIKVKNIVLFVGRVTEPCY